MKRLVLGVCMATATACSGRVSEPSGLADPVGPVTFVIRNTTTADVYVRWQQSAPVCDVNLGGKHLDIRTWCSTPCDQGCSCLECQPQPPEVRRVEAGGKLSFTWSGTWYEPMSCGNGCTCDQPRGTLAGSYEVSVAAARGYKGVGSSPPIDKDGVLSPAELDLAKGACEAQITAKLSPGAQTIDLPLTCTP